VFDRGHIFRHEIIADEIALFDGCPKLPGRRIKREPNRITSAARVYALTGAVRIEFRYSSANGRVSRAHVRRRADGNIHLRTRLIENNVASPVPGSAWKFDKLFGFPLRFGLAGFVLESHYAVRVSDVDIVAPEGQSEWPIEPAGEHESLVYTAVSVRVAQY